MPPAAHRPTLPPAHRVVIVGAGLAGAATAYHLRRLGVQDIVVLEQEPVPGVHASGRNAAMVRQEMDDARLQPLSDASVAVLRSGRLAEYRRCGSLLLGAGEDQASKWIPAARGSGNYNPDNGVVDVAALLQAFLRGIDVRYGTEVRDFRASPEGCSLQTNGGRMHARVLVNAAGPWAGVLTGLPLTPMRRHLFTSAPDTAVDPERPWLWDLEAGYYVRPESGGLLLCACDETPAAPGDYRDDPEVLLDLLQKLATHQPEWPEPRVVHHWTGQRTFADDRLPVIGFDVARPNLFHVAGLGGHGVTLSDAVGRLAARTLLGLESAGGAPWDPARLGCAVATSSAPHADA